MLSLTHICFKTTFSGYGHSFYDLIDSLIVNSLNITFMAYEIKSRVLD